MDAVGIPNVRWYSIEGDYNVMPFDLCIEGDYTLHNVMVLDLLGPSLEGLSTTVDGDFD